MDDINEYNIILAILRYLETSRRNNTINAFTAFYQIDILKEIVHANYQETFHILKICEFLLDLFFGRYIEICRNFMLFNFYVPIMELIGSFYKNGERYTIFFQEFDFEFISDSLLLEFVDININIAAAGCMFDIINLKEGDGVKLFFEKDEKYEKFLKFITIDENTPCRKKIAFYRSSGLIFKNYI